MEGPASFSFPLPFSLRPWVTPVRVAVAARLVQALATRTYASPDEYWQGPEVAHRLVWGTGYTTWEWDQDAQLRSFVHPLIIAAAYWPLKITGLDFLPLVWLAPHIVQALASAIADVAVFRLSLLLFGSPSAAWCAYAANLVSWFGLFAGARAFSNGIEMALTAYALLLWKTAIDAVTVSAKEGGGGGREEGEEGGARRALLSAPEEAAKIAALGDGDAAAHNNEHDDVEEVVGSRVRRRATSSVAKGKGKRGVGSSRKGSSTTATEGEEDGFAHDDNDAGAASAQEHTEGKRKQKERRQRLAMVGGTLATDSTTHFFLPPSASTTPSWSPSFNLVLVGVCAGVATSVRPTSLLIWIFLAFCAFPQVGFQKLTLLCLRHVLPGAVAALGVAALIDRALYGAPHVHDNQEEGVESSSSSSSLGRVFVFTPVNFLSFNLFSGLDALYGEYHPLWYIYNAIPAMLGLFLPFFILGLYFSVKRGGLRATDLALSSLFVVLMLSLPSHKEHRFLLPLLPISSLYIGYGLALTHAALHGLQWRWGKGAIFYSPDLVLGEGKDEDGLGVEGEEEQGGDAASTSALAGLPHASTPWIFRILLKRILTIEGRRKAWNILCLSLLFSNVAVGLFLNLHHQRGPVEVAEEVGRKAAAAATWQLERMQVDYLMPCHSAPFYSVVHSPATLRQLDCSPGARVPWLGGTFRSAICAETGCCTVEQLPAISETDAWVRNPGAVLHALYGHVPAQPLACIPGLDVDRDDGVLLGLSSGGSSAGGSRFPRPERAAAKQRRGWTSPRMEAAAITPVAFAAEFGTPLCHLNMTMRGLTPSPVISSSVGGKEGREGGGAGGPKPRYGRLPSHALFYGADTRLPVVGRWLKENNYILSFSSYYSSVSGDAHVDKHAAAEEASPSWMVLYEHACWATGKGVLEDEEPFAELATQEEREEAKSALAGVAKVPSEVAAAVVEEVVEKVVEKVVEEGKIDAPIESQGESNVGGTPQEMPEHDGAAEEASQEEMHEQREVGGEGAAEAQEVQQQQEEQAQQQEEQHQQEQQQQQQEEEEHHQKEHDHHEKQHEEQPHQEEQQPQYEAMEEGAQQQQEQPQYEVEERAEQLQEGEAGENRQPEGEPVYHAQEKEYQQEQDQGQEQQQVHAGQELQDGQRAVEGVEGEGPQMQPPEAQEEGGQGEHQQQAEVEQPSPVAIEEEHIPMPPGDLPPVEVEVEEGGEGDERVEG